MRDQPRLLDLTLLAESLIPAILSLTEIHWNAYDEKMLTQFLSEEGFDTTSDSYYSEIDKRMKDTFPHRFDKVSPTQSVSSVNRSASPGRRKSTVRLTPSQVAISKKLGVPLSEYAKYVKE